MDKRKKELMRSLKFLLVSVSAGIIQVLSFTLLEELTPAPHWLSYLVSLILSVLWNFTFNRKFTFHSAGNIPVAMTKVELFYVVFTPLSTWWTDALTKSGVNEYLVLAGTMIVNFVTEFLYDRFFVFGKTLDTDGKAR